MKLYRNYVKPFSPRTLQLNKCRNYECKKICAVQHAACSCQPAGPGPATGRKPAPGRRPAGKTGNERMVEAMKERLDLSDDQVTKLKEIYKKSADEFRKLREETAEIGRAHV